MRKSNWIFYIIAAIISLFLIGLWFYHGFNHIDSPLDPILTIIWFIIMLTAGIIIHKTEQARKEKMRRIYLFDNGFYNVEAGETLFNNNDKVASIKKVIASLQYPLSIQDNNIQKPFTHRIATTKFKSNQWSGTVTTIRTNETQPFKTQEELKTILDFQESTTEMKG